MKIDKKHNVAIWHHFVVVLICSIKVQIEATEKWSLRWPC